MYIDMASILHAAMKKGVQLIFAPDVLAEQHVLMCFSVCSVQPPSFSPNPVCKARQHHGPGLSSKERHVCIGWASPFSKALDTKV